jgi:ankyrin repeat protein
MKRTAAEIADYYWPTKKIHKTSPCWKEALEKDDLNKLEELITSKKYDINNITNSDCHHAIHVAAQNGSIKSIERLVELGAHVNELGGEEYYGTTPLHCTASNDHAGAIEKLVELGADVNLKEGVSNRFEGETPLDLAFERCSDIGTFGSVKKLIELGADASSIKGLIPWAARNV